MPRESIVDRIQASLAQFPEDAPPAATTPDPGRRRHPGMRPHRPQHHRPQDDIVDAVIASTANWRGVIRDRNETPVFDMLARAQERNRANAAQRLPPIIEDPFIPTPEQGEILERIAQLKALVAVRGFGKKRKALEDRLAKLVAQLPSQVMPDVPVTEPRLARRPAITEMRVLDPAQAGAPGGTVNVPVPEPTPIVIEAPTPPYIEAPPPPVVDENHVTVHGAMDNRPLRVRRSIRDHVQAILTGRR